MYEDEYLDSYWEDQNEIPDAHDEWDEWEKDRLAEDLAAEAAEERAHEEELLDEELPEMDDDCPW